MFDTIIRRGFVVDGTGAPGAVADVGISAGRIAAIGEISESATREVDATGRVVCPGFIDIHTHYDAQLLWDPDVSPTPLHGVTTIMAGNCGLSLAPVRPEDRDFTARMLSRVEAIPLDALTQGFEWEWETFPELMRHVETRDVTINVGFLVGHAAVRRWAMGPAASEREATNDEIATMSDLVHQALAAGAMGFSTSTAMTQHDGDGNPTPARFASPEELIALAACCADHPGTNVEFIPGSASYGFDPDRKDVQLLAAMSRESGRPVNWNTVLLRYPGKPDIADLQLDAVDEARSSGGFVVPMIIPHNFRVRTDFLDSDVGFRSVPAMQSLFALDVAGRLEALRPGIFRDELISGLLHSPDGPNKMFLSSIPDYEISDVGLEAMQYLVGAKLGDLARKRGSTPMEVACDLAVEAKLEIGFQNFVGRASTAEQKDLRRRVLRDRRLILGASDGGAHVRGVINVEYPTASFKELVRDEAIFSVEELVQEFTDVPATLYGLIDRGRLAEGAWADVVIFDPASIESSPVVMRRDFPGGAARLYNHGIGIDAVLVAGEEIVRNGELTGVRPGRVLHSGVDSADVPWDAMLQRRRSA